MIMYIQLSEFLSLHPEIKEIHIVSDKKSTLHKRDQKELAKHLVATLNPVRPEVTWEDFIRIWNTVAERNPEWRKVKDSNKDIKRRFTSVVKDFPKIEDWELIIEGMEADPFFSGRDGNYDRPKPLTLFMKRRWEDFYETGKEARDKPKEQSIDEFLASLSPAPEVTPFPHTRKDGEE